MGPRVRGDDKMLQRVAQQRVALLHRANVRGQRHRLCQSIRIGRRRGRRLVREKRFGLRRDCFNLKRKVDRNFSLVRL